MSFLNLEHTSDVPFSKATLRDWENMAISFPKTEVTQRLCRALDMRGDGIPRIDWEEWNDREVDKICGTIFSK